MKRRTKTPFQRLVSALWGRTGGRLVAAGRPRAVVLILVLWIGTILSLLAYSVTYQLGLETRISSVRKKSLQAKCLARAGLARGFVDLRNDMIFDSAEDVENPFDALGDSWARPEEGKTEEELGPGVFDVRIVDEESLLNINLFGAANRLLLEKIIQDIGYNEEDAKITASAIVDYADPDTSPALDSATGEEAIAYGILRADMEGGDTDPEEVERVEFANEPYLTVDALLDVFGVTPELYFGPGTPEAQYYRNQLGLQQRGERFIIKERRRSRIDSERPLGLRDYFTIHGNGTLNMNTAPEHVLVALFSTIDGVDAESLAERVVNRRTGGRERDIDNEDAFKTIDSLKDISELAAIFGQIQAFYILGVQSSVFTLTSTGRVGQVQQTLEVTVHRSLNEFQLDETFETSDRRDAREELYEKRRERRVDSEDDQLVRIPSVRIIEWNQI